MNYTLIDRKQGVENFMSVYSYIAGYRLDESVGGDQGDTPSATVQFKKKDISIAKS